MVRIIVRHPEFSDAVLWTCDMTSNAWFESVDIYLMVELFLLDECISEEW